MEAKFSYLFIACGVACFLIGALSLIKGQLEGVQIYALPATGLLLIGGGAAGLRKPGARNQ